MSFTTHKPKISQKNKKKPPPRPPPPNFSKYKSKSSLNLNHQFENLIEWSPPNSPKPERTQTFGGSVSSSFSSSTSSLASSKKSFEYETPTTNNLWPVNFNNINQVSNGKLNNRTAATVNTSLTQNQVTCKKPNNISGNSTFYTETSEATLNIPAIFGPTIIRAQINPSGKLNGISDPRHNNTHGSGFCRQDLGNSRQDVSLPSTSGFATSRYAMPSIPPPSPPRGVEDVQVPFGIALYDYPATDPRDLPFQANDVVLLIRRINDEWYYGKCFDREGMFPSNFIDVQVPLNDDGSSNIATALYAFSPQMPGDLELKPGQAVKVTRKINNDWLFGESGNKSGQFPSNYIDRIPEF